MQSQTIFERAAFDGAIDERDLGEVVDKTLPKLKHFMRDSNYEAVTIDLLNQSACRLKHRLPVDYSVDAPPEDFSYRCCDARDCTFKAIYNNKAYCAFDKIRDLIAGKPQ